MKKKWIMWIISIHLARESQKSDPCFLKKHGSIMDHVDHTRKVIHFCQKNMDQAKSFSGCRKTACLPKQVIHVFSKTWIRFLAVRTAEKAG